ADPQGHLWPRRHDDRLAQERPQPGPRDPGLPCPAELCAPEGHFAGRRQLRQRQLLFLRTLILGAPVRRPVDPDAAGPGRPPAATAVYPVILSGWISEQNQRSRLSGEFVYG